MVPLRSKLPYSGRVTLRHAVPTITPAGSAFELRQQTTTTPKVAVPSTHEDGETPAGKGGEAR
jgi:hypothetical protein